MVSCEWPPTVVRDRSSALCWPPRHSIFPPRSLHANCCDLDKMTVAPGEVAKQFSRTQIRRLQRRHTQLSYHQLKQRLLDILVPSPPALKAVDLFSNRIKLFIVEPLVLGVDFGHRCQLHQLGPALTIVVLLARQLLTIVWSMWFQYATRMSTQAFLRPTLWCKCLSL